MQVFVVITTDEVVNSPIGSKLVDPSVNHWVARKITTSKPFLELRLRRMDRVQPKTDLNFEFILVSCPWYLEVEFLYTFRTLRIHMKSEI